MRLLWLPPTPATVAQDVLASGVNFALNTAVLNDNGLVLSPAAGAFTEVFGTDVAAAQAADAAPLLLLSMPP